MLSVPKRFPKIAILGAACLLLVVVMATPIMAAPVKGDVNGDGVVDLGDVILALRIALNVTTPTADQIAAADVAPVIGWGQPVGDGKVTIADAARILRVVVGFIPPTGLASQPTGATFMGVDTCKLCHSDVHTDWLTTRHSQAFKTLQDAKNDTNPQCVGCHTVGYGQPGGFVDAQTTPNLENVQCEDCHGPGSLHVAGGGDKTKILAFPDSVAGQVCGKCHTDTHHPTYEEWRDSPHGQIVDHVAQYFAAGQNAATCGPCHSGEARLATAVLNVPIPDAKSLRWGVTCVVCHNPHKATGNNPPFETAGQNDVQLRYSTESQDLNNPNVCGQCHHARSDDVWTKVSRPPHHSQQFNFLLGAGGILNPDQQIKSAHASVPGQCSHCHMSTKEFESEESPASTGHTFEVNVAGCAPCHTADDANAKLQATQGEITNSLAALKARLDKWGNWEFISNGGPKDANSQQPMIPDAIKQARWNYYMVLNDGSEGVHNANYARALIQAANADLDAAGVPK
jgi:protein-arginine kinase activator protein McsA